jgi:transmembrane sensor
MSPRLPTPLKTTLEIPRDEARVERMWNRIRAAESAPEPRRTPAAAWAAGFALAAAACVFFFVSRGRVPGGPLRAPDGSELTLGSMVRVDRTEYSDGSSIEFEPGTTSTVVLNDGERFIMQLFEGQAHFIVRPGGPRRWSVEAGPIRVHVTGTRFVVENRARYVRVEVEEGSVRVEGERVDAGAVSLTRGQHVRVDLAPDAGALDHSSDGIATPEGEPEHAASEPRPRPSASPRQREARAPEEPAQDSPPSAATTGPMNPPAEDAAALLTLADQARRERRMDDALSLLDRAAGLGTVESGVAALTRARLLLDSARPRPATADLNRALDLGLPNSLEELTRSLLVRAHCDSGDLIAARAAAVAYEQRYPRGRWLATNEGWIRNAEVAPHE